jgi:hypothetical protein
MESQNNTKMSDTDEKQLLNWRDNKKKWSANLSPEKLKRIRKANAARQAERRRNETLEQAAERKKRDVMYKVGDSTLSLCVHLVYHFV